MLLLSGPNGLQASALLMSSLSVSLSLPLLVEPASSSVGSYWRCSTMALGLRYNFKMSIQSLDKNPVECAWNLSAEMETDVKAG